MTEIVSAATRQAESPGGNGRKPGRERAAAVPGAMSLERVMEPTELDQFAGARVTEMLRQALAGHQPVVKLVVAERLVNHASFRELAGKTGLSVEEVADILARMRGWVARFTAHFRDDWHWVEGAKLTVTR
jgi:hypothetical protein